MKPWKFINKSQTGKLITCSNQFVIEIIDFNLQNKAIFKVCTLLKYFIRSNYIDTNYHAKNVQYS